MIRLLLRFDQDAVIWISARRRPASDLFMAGISHLGDGSLWWGMGLIAVFFGKQGAVVGRQLGIAYCVELGLYKLIKNMVNRHRPFVQIPLVTGLVVPPDEFSFPSGHTAAAFVMMTVMGLAYPAAFLPLLSLALLIGISRVYLGVHYPSDVVAGAILGVFAGSLGLMLG